MKKVLFIASLLLVFVAQTDAKAKKALTEKDMGAYLFTYFNDPTHSLFMVSATMATRLRLLTMASPLLPATLLPTSEAYAILISTVLPMANSTLP